MEQTEPQDGSSRRSVLRTSAMGVGALIAGAAVAGAVASPAEAATAFDSAAASGAGLAATAAAVSLSGRYFLTLAGISGASIDAKHKGAIDVIDSSWGLTGGIARAAFSAFHFTALTNVDSPVLFLYCAAGKTITQAQLDIVQNPSLGVNIKVILKDVRVTAYSTQNTSTPQQIDAVSLSFNQIEFGYAPIRSDGTLGATITTSWNVLTNSQT